MKKYFIFLFLFSLILYTACQFSVKEKTPIKAPGFTLEDIHGNSVSLKDYEGKVILLDFWATWCPPCIKEMPVLQDLYETHRENGFEIIGISVDVQGAVIVKPLIEEIGVTFPNLIYTEEVVQSYGEGNPEILNAYGPLQGIPSTFIINRNGEIVQKYVGEVPRRILETHIQELLEEQIS
jgi:peroxiredoxin